MKVIFLEDVPGTADAGEVKDVKNGFARNFLLPRELAAPATADNLQRIRAIEKAANERRLKYSEEWKTVAKALEGRHITVEARVGPTGRLFGAITGRQIASELSKQIGRDLDHRMVLLSQAIHEPGDQNVTIRLYRNVQAHVKVSVVPEGFVRDQAAKAAADETAPPQAAENAAEPEQPAQA
ncbi:MAG: 50S ribosomal protein L9 [SAR202 cluster bacterium]|nr:50S ribosomal protein L9 [SAR202 cluster bacterium]